MVFGTPRDGHGEGSLKFCADPLQSKYDLSRAREEIDQEVIATFGELRRIAE